MDLVTFSYIAYKNNVSICAQTFMLLTNIHKSVKQLLLFHQHKDREWIIPHKEIIR